MRVYDIICEAIPQPIRNLNLYAKNRLKDIKRLEQIAARMKEIEPNLEGGPERDIRSYLEQSGMDRDDAWDALSSVESLASRAGSTYSGFHLDSIRHSLEWMYSMMNDTKNRGRDVHHILKSVEHVAGYLGYDTETNFDLLKRLGGMVDQIEQGLVEEGYIDPRYFEPEDIQEYKTWYEAIKLAGQFSTLWQPFVASKQKLDDLLSMRQALAFEKKPKTDERETLYHASTWAGEIAKNGFQAEAPGSGIRKGLGTYGSTTNVVSFTHDIHLARNIARSLKELVMIANGKIRKHHVLRWLQDEGIDMKRITSSAGYDVENAKDTPQTTAKLFHVWLWLNEVGRENPVFTNIEDTVKMFRGRNENDVGIIASEVDMQNPEISYQPAESEWRVPPESILSVKRIQ